MRKGVNYNSLCLAMKELRQGGEDPGAQSHKHSLREGESLGQERRGPGWDRFPHTRKLTVRADSHFNIIFLQVGGVWRRQRPRARKAYSVPFQFKVTDPDLCI